MKKNKTLSNFKQLKPFNTGTLDLTMERYELDKSELIEEIHEPMSVSHETKNPFWNSLKDRLGKHEESLPEMIEELSAKEESILATYTAPMKANISASMVVHGNLETETPLSIRGTVFGNVSCKDVVDARHHFRIHGEVKAESFYSFGGTVTGDITCTQKIEIGQDSVVFGHLSAQQIVVTGKVEGNLVATQSIRLNSTAVVTGNLIAARFAVEPGAILQGNCVIKADIKE